MEMSRAEAQRLSSDLGLIAGGEGTAREGTELSGLAVLAIRDAQIVYDAYFGRRYIDEKDPSKDLLVDGDTKFRLASISKVVVGIGAMILVERGLLELDRDLGDYLGFPLRNPHYPKEIITAAMLMSHTSSIRDIEDYNLPLGLRLEEFFLPGASRYSGGGHFAAALCGRDAGPGRFYCYCNLNYGVLATAMERISGERFDRYMREKVLKPLGMDASFNVLDLSDQGFADLATLYRKAGADEVWRPSGPWIPQVDDYRGLRPASPCRLSPGLGPEALNDYEIGTNGTLFSPQGGLRCSARDLSRIMLLFMGKGELEGTRLLMPESIAAMMSRRWTWDPATRNGELEDGGMRETGLALAHGTDWSEAGSGDRPTEAGGHRLWGHHGDAYGLLGGFYFESERGYGYIYLLGGSGVDPATRKGRYSSYTTWEEEIQTALLGSIAQRGEPSQGGRAGGEAYETGLALWRVSEGGFDGWAFTENGSAGTGEALGPVLEIPFPFVDAIPSWNADCPKGGWIEVGLRARLAASPGSWTPWYEMGIWAPPRAGDDPSPLPSPVPDRSSVPGQDDELASVSTDTLCLKQPATALQLRFRLCGAEGLMPTIRNAALAYSRAKPARGTLGSTAQQGAGKRRRAGPLVAPPLGVPRYSQMIYPDGGNTWCSPTSVAMVLAFWKPGGPARDEGVRGAVAGVYDKAYEGCGNWSFNAAYAGSSGCDALVARFTRLEELEPFIAAGIPLIMSVSWNNEEGRPLSAAPVSRSAGHLTVLVGFDGAGDAVMNEPAAADETGVRRSYARHELEARWLEASGGTCYLIVPQGASVPGLGEAP